jgi:secretion/DNA translocation related TadE-like protein
MRNGAEAVREDRGSATVWALTGVAVLCVVFAAVLALGQAVSTRHRAGGAADLAALAAADHAPAGARAACTVAQRVAVAQNARVVRCTVQDGIADLTAKVRWGPYTSEVRSRAGQRGHLRPVQAGHLPAPERFMRSVRRGQAVDHRRMAAVLLPGVPDREEARPPVETPAPAKTPGRQQGAIAASCRARHVAVPAVGQSSRPVGSRRHERSNPGGIQCVNHPTARTLPGCPSLPTKRVLAALT